MYEKKYYESVTAHMAAERIEITSKKSKDSKSKDPDNGYVRGPDGWVHINVETHPSGAGRGTSTRRRSIWDDSNQQSWSED